MPPMMTDRPMTSLNFATAGTFHFQLSPKLPTMAFDSHVKEARHNVQVQTVGAFSCCSHSS